MLGIKFEENLEVPDDKSEDVVGDNKTVCTNVHADTPVKPNVVDDENQKLYYTDSQAFTGPMTQLMKTIFPSPSDPTDFMQVDDDNRVDCVSLPNLNESFSEFDDNGFDQTPHYDLMDMDVDEKETNNATGKEIVVLQADVLKEVVAYGAVIQKESPEEEGAEKGDELAKEVADIQKEPAGEG